jgi:protein involved in polysaccharide export with SLBB domain
MDTGGRRSICWAGLLALLAGCAGNRGQIEQALLAHRPPPAHSHQVAALYQARCPDLLQVEIADLPRHTGPHRIGADGRIDLGDAGRPQVEGETTPDILRTVAESVGVPAEQVHVSVVEYNSQYIYLFCQAPDSQRVVPYQGPESVLDLLHRAGGLPAGSAVGDITIVRPHVAEGKTPEVFHIDLAAIVLRKDPETNILLEPFDQVHIGQSRRARFHDCLPPWLRRWFGG